MKVHPSTTKPFSLSSKVRLGAVTLSAAGAAVGSASFYGAAAIGADAFEASLAGFAVAALVALVLGNFLSKKLIAPVLRLGLAAQSLDRNPSAQVDTETGSFETDEVLASLRRANRQLVSYVYMMESAAAGNTAGLVLPEGSEKLMAAFQKVAVQVAGAVEAKQKFSGLNDCLTALETELRKARSQSPAGEVRGVDGQTESIAAAINEMICSFEDSLRVARSVLHESEPILVSTILNLRNGIQIGDLSTQNVSRAVAILKEAPDRIKLLADAYRGVQLPAERLQESFGEGSVAVKDLASRINSIQRQHNELNRKLRKLRERSQMIAASARSVEDLSRRANLLALNTSLSADAGSDPSTFANEFRSLSDRAQRVQKEINVSNGSLEKEIDDTESMVRYLLSESAELLVISASVSEIVENVEPLLAGLSGLPERIGRLVEEHGRDREDLTRTLTALYFDLEKIGPQLRDTEQDLTRIRTAIEPLMNRGSNMNRAPETDAVDRVPTGHSLIPQPAEI